MVRRSVLAFASLIVVCSIKPAGRADDLLRPDPPGASSHDWTEPKGPFAPRSLAIFRETAPARIQQALDGLAKDERSTTRGVKEQQVYASVSPAVVLVTTPEGLGSGSVLSTDGLILTSYHVVEGHENVAVAFKPDAGTELERSQLYRAKVWRVDATKDLALLKVLAPPARLATIPLGQLSEISIGSDVHAIGHPKGLRWTYTRGLVSQIRQHYEWTVPPAKRHEATVIQTQTPISPGNSGGPLISDAGHLIGVNTFSKLGDELHFAVAVDEIVQFQARSTTSEAVPSAPCRGLASQRLADEKHRGFVTKYDTLCSGMTDAILFEPYDSAKPAVLFVDSKGRGKWDVEVYDYQREGKFERSIWRNDDGSCRIVGIHDTGTPEPTRWERCPKH
ncbi:MAG TPA: serine protease [Thermoanaerobaculia bacterium]